MPARGSTVTAISDVPANDDVADILDGKPNMTLKRRSAVEIYLTREAVGILATVLIGGSVVMPQGPVNIATVVGSIPSVQDDGIISVIADAGDEIIVAGTNTTAGALELRALVKLLPL